MRTTLIILSVLLIIYSALFRVAIAQNVIVMAIFLSFAFFYAFSSGVHCAGKPTAKKQRIGVR